MVHNNLPPRLLHSLTNYPTTVALGPHPTRCRFTGIWMCRGKGMNVLVMDVEGTDGRERGEDQVCSSGSHFAFR